MKKKSLTFTETVALINDVAIARRQIADARVGIAIDTDADERSSYSERE